MRLPLTLTVFATFSTAAILSLAAASFSASVIEENSEAGVQAELDKSGLDWAQVHAEGLGVFLTGVAPTEAERFIAMSRAGTVVDAARVIDNMEVEATAALAPPKFSVEILRNEAGVSLIGLIPASVDRDRLTSRLNRITDSDDELTDFLETADYPTPESWNAAMNYAVSALSDLPRSKISVSANLVEITAMTDSAEDKMRLQNQLQDDSPDNVIVRLDISAPRPVITPFTLRAIYQDEALRFDACSADTDTSRRAILKAAKEMGLPNSSDCTIGLGVPSPTWTRAVTVSLDALKQLEGGTVTITDADISILAPEGTDEGVFDRIVAETEKALPELFALQAVLPVVEDGEANIQEFVATRSPEGLMQMRGRLGSELTRATIESYAQARFGSENIYDATRLSENLPQGWTVRVMAALDALAVLNNGAVIVTPDLMDVSGKSGQEDASAQVSQLFASRLGGAQQFDLKIEYVEALDPLANIPTPEECIANLQTVQTENKISFEPGSGNLDSASHQILDELAKILETCGELGLEIQGHTDSQGGENMNLALSQERAQSVLAALRVRRIQTGSFIANGYGEAFPIADNETADGRESNRRIEFVLLKPDEPENAETSADDQESLESTEEPVEENQTEAQPADQETPSDVQN